MLAETADPEWHFYFMLCMESYQHLYVCFPVYLDVMQGLLTMAMKNALLSSSEASELMGKIKTRGTHHEAAEEASGSFTIDFGLALTDPDDAKAHNLALRFNELAMFDEIINEDYVDVDIGNGKLKKSINKM
jgi:hypothetical protein